MTGARVRDSTPILVRSSSLGLFKTPNFMGGDEEMRSEDLISHPDKIMGKKSIKHQILYALCFF